MASLTITDGNLYVMKKNSTIATDTITHDTDKACEIHTQKIEYDLQNQIGAPPIPVPPGQIGSKTPYQRVNDLKRISKAITIQGHLVDESGQSSTKKRNILIDLMENEHGLIALWGTSGNYRTIFGNTTTDKCFIQQAKYTETAGIYGEEVSGDSQPFRKIDIQMILFIGKDLVD